MMEPFHTRTLFDHKRATLRDLSVRAHATATTSRASNHQRLFSTTNVTRLFLVLGVFWIVAVVWASVSMLSTSGGRPSTNNSFLPPLRRLSPRVVYYDGFRLPSVTYRTVDSCAMIHCGLKKNASQMDFFLPSNTTGCEPMASWQTTSFPTCNNIHEIDLAFGEEHVKMLEPGGWRYTWKFEPRREETFALKTLRFTESKGFDSNTLRRHVVDAVAAERLTSSPHVIGIYGYCGHSVINDFANKGNLFRYMQQHELSASQKLVMARDVALGVADLHGIEGDDHAAPIVHHDLMPPNVMVVEDDERKKPRVIINDFNDAQFVQWNTITQQPCGFRRRRWTPTYRAPEEVWERQLSDKIDIYALGGIFFFIMTGGQEPYDQEEEDNHAETYKLIARGVRAKLPNDIQDSTDPAFVLLKNIIRKCQEYQPWMRPSAREVANELNAAVKSLNL